jgi:predicted lipoprotein with Yx(FWY)xxD motif
MSTRWLMASLTLGVFMLLAACGGEEAVTPAATAARAPATAATSVAPPKSAATTAASATAAPSGSPKAASTPTTAAGPTTVHLGDTPLGKVLVDERGRTLYVFANDPPNEGKSACNGPCAALWPAVAAPATGTPSKPADVPGALTVITRDDGSRQVAYAGLPLYRYASDAAPGETRGEGVGGVWSVARP